MANHLRQLRGGRVSFFLFMDTITAVTAMLIMVALMMTLYMGGSPVFPLSPSSSTAKPDELLAQAAQITLQNQAVRAALTSVNATPDTNRLRADIVSLQGQVISLSNDLARQDARLRQQETETREKVNQLVVAEHRQQIEEAKRLWDELKASNQLVQAASADLVEKTKDAEARLERAKREGSKIWLIPDAGGAAKQPSWCASRGPTWSVSALTNRTAAAPFPPRLGNGLSENSSPGCAPIETTSCSISGPRGSTCSTPSMISPSALVSASGWTRSRKTSRLSSANRRSHETPSFARSR